MQSTKKMHTVKEVCDLLRCSRRTLFRMIERGEIVYTHRRGCHILFSQEEIENYVKSIKFN